MNLHEGLKTDIQVGGHKLKLDLSFDRVLKAYAALERKDLDEVSRQRLTLSYLLSDSALKRARKFSNLECLKVLEEILNVFLKIPGRKSNGGKKLFDFDQDVTRILAGFRQAYDIDLYAEQGKLDWRVFIALLSNLPNDTKFSEICDLRHRPIPPITSSNFKHVNALIEAQTFWALNEDIGEKEKANFQEGINTLASTLIAMAKAGKNNG